MDEGYSGGEFGADGDKGGEDAGIAVGEILDFESEVTSLGEVR